MHLLHEQSGGGLPASYDSYDSTTVKKIEGNTSRSTFMQNAVPPGFLEAALKYSTHFLLAAAKGFRWHKRHVLQSFTEHSVVQVTGWPKNDLNKIFGRRERVFPVCQQPIKLKAKLGSALDTRTFPYSLDETDGI